MCRTVLPDRVFYVFNGAATVGILPVMLFAGGWPGIHLLSIND
jgi:hypothetical protein